ncbi:MarR family winged helix-turn-helix transcriptional regulator [Methylobacterium brachythecii]|uniref:DNA-binding MarR family transcriptional regulator n=1 Tax=Methylobacterium brachythecii TaxID=1176177 RepID=A0A7W6AMB8_9HYPH|nr:MarR family winged helix-turn-helix transcriptional regulator [Methylobacterium brachythecii]MBB3902312.1 DNA-binding MarR family transcriptional regulator [Methylobacterium brachythecii]
MSSDGPCLCSSLRRITRSVTATYDAALKPVDLRITQFSVLRTLSRLGPVSVTRLAAETALDRSTMGRNLDPLERRGLVRLEVGEADQRERVVHLTAAGTAAIDSAMPYWREAQGRVADAMGPSTFDDVAERLSALQRV